MNAPPKSTDPLNDRALDHAVSDVARVLAENTVADALAEIQQSKIESRIVYIYVVDRDGRLQGVVPTRRLLLSPPSTPITEIMVKRVVSVPSDATLLDACELFILHRLLALPITDRDRRLLGVIDVDQYTDEIQQLDEREQSDEIFQLIGVRVSQVGQASLPKLFSRRFPWLLCNVVGGLICAIIASFFQPVLERVVILAIFIPVVLALAESVSIQSLTLVLQRQHGRRAPWSEIARNLLREMPLGLMLGLACGILVAGFAWMWRAGIATALSIFASITLSVMVAASLGVLVPLVLHRMQRDPKLAAGPLTLALADVVALTCYLGQGTLWLM